MEIKNVISAKIKNEMMLLLKLKNVIVSVFSSKIKFLDFSFLLKNGKKY